MELVTNASTAGVWILLIDADAAEESPPIDDGAVLALPPLPPLSPRPFFLHSPPPRPLPRPPGLCGGRVAWPLPDAAASDGAWRPAMVI